MGVYIKTIREKYDSDKQKWVAVSKSRMDNIQECEIAGWLDDFSEKDFPDDITDESKEMLSECTYGKGCLFFSQDFVNFLNDVITEEREKYNGVTTDIITDAILLKSLIKKMVCFEEKECRMIFCFE